MEGCSIVCDTIDGVGYEDKNGLIFLAWTLSFELTKTEATGEFGTVFGVGDARGSVSAVVEKKIYCCCY